MLENLVIIDKEDIREALTEEIKKHTDLPKTIKFSIKPQKYNIDVTCTYNKFTELDIYKPDEITVTFCHEAYLP